MFSWIALQPLVVLGLQQLASHYFQVNELAGWGTVIGGMIANAMMMSGLMEFEVGLRKHKSRVVIAISGIDFGLMFFPGADQPVMILITGIVLFSIMIWMCEELEHQK